MRSGESISGGGSVAVKDEAERIVAEQALLAYRASKLAAYGAAHGRGLEVAERAVLEEGRKTMRVMLEQVIAAQPGVGKGGPTPSPVRVPRGRG
jgi:hypothetical protein